MNMPLAILNRRRGGGAASLVEFTFGPTISEVLDLWGATFGAERIDIDQAPSALTPIATFGDEIITVTG